MSTIDLALVLITGDAAGPPHKYMDRTLTQAVAWEIEDEIASKTGRARFGPLQALAGDLDALEASIGDVDAWLAKNVDDLAGVEEAVRDVTDDARKSEAVKENLESLDRVLARVVASAPAGLGLHPRAEQALRLRDLGNGRDVTRGADQLRAALKNVALLKKEDTYRNLRSLRDQQTHLDRVARRFAADAAALASRKLVSIIQRQDSVGGTTVAAQRAAVLVKRQASAHDRVLKDASLKTLCGALARIRAARELKKCHRAWAEASKKGVYTDAITAVAVSRRREPFYIQRLLDDLVGVVDKEQAFAKKVFGLRDDDCLRVQFKALREACAAATAAPGVELIAVYAACDRRGMSTFVTTLLQEVQGDAADGFRAEARRAGDRCDAQDLKRYRKRDHKLGGAPADGAAFACSLCDAVEKALGQLKDPARPRTQLVEPAYKALLARVDALIERTATANAKHAQLSRVETLFFVAHRLRGHAASPRLVAYAAKCRALAKDAAQAYATFMVDGAFPKASKYFDARARGAATSAKGFDAARAEVAKTEKALRSMADRLEKHVAARGDDALRRMLRAAVFDHAAAALASYDALARADGRWLDDSARAVAVAKRMRAY